MSNVQSESPYTSPIPPPKTRRKKYDVLRSVANEKVRGVCLHQELIPVFTHWHPDASGKVRHRETGCHWCEFFDPNEVRWYGYMPAWSDMKGKVVALEVTHQAALDCAALSKKRTPLRGLELSLFRYGNNNHNRAGCTVADYSSRKALPPPIDIEEFLDAIFSKAEQVPVAGGAPRWKEEAQP